MKTSLTTFRGDLRRALVDLLFAQWQALGVPLTSNLAFENFSVIDPEALLWCSLEFIQNEPRLEEGVISWVRTNRDYLIRQRVNRLAVASDARTSIWRAIDRAPRQELTASPTRRTRDARQGQSSRREPHEYCKELETRANRRVAKPIGKPSERASALLLRARDLLGNDVRHFILVYLLSNRHGGRIRTIQQWAGYSYRALSDAATRWERAEVLSIDHGFCRLTDPIPWHSLLQHDSNQAILIDWSLVLETCVQLLRAFAKAEQKNLGIDSSVIRSQLQQSEYALSSAVLTDGTPPPESVKRLKNLLSRST